MKRDPREAKSRLTETSRKQIERVLDEKGWQSLEATTIEDWHSADLDALRVILGDDQFQAFLDEISDGDAHEHDAG